jgi:hypothetical protein
MRRLLILFPATALLSACVVGTVAKTAVDVASLPVKVASAGVDAVTTSQAEADRNLGRKMRKQDEERGRQWRLAWDRCRNGRQLPTDDCSAFQQR